MPSGVYPRPPKTFDRKAYMKRWYLLHQESEKGAALQNYYRDSDGRKEKHRIWSKNNRDKVNAYRREQYKNPLFKLGMILRGRFNKAVTRGNNRAIDLIGCTMDELKTHLEAQFKEGMTWDNWNYRGWHIDHITPIKLFDLGNADELKKAFHYSNLQPMWGVDNMRKGAKIHVENSGNNFKWNNRRKESPIPV